MLLITFLIHIDVLCYVILLSKDVKKVCKVWFVPAISHPGLEVLSEMRDDNKAQQGRALVVVCLRHSV